MGNEKVSDAAETLREAIPALPDGVGLQRVKSALVQLESFIEETTRPTPSGKAKK